MRTLSPTLATKLDSGVSTLARAWRLTRTDGVQVAITEHDQDITSAGTVFRASGGLIGQDVEADSTLAPNRTALSGALSAEAISEEDLALGRWDHAKIEALWVDWQNPADSILMWSGLVQSVTWQGTAFEFDVAGPESLLKREIGRVYARTCDATLGDQRCKVDLNQAGRRVQVALVQILTEQTFKVACPAGFQAAPFLDGGATFVSGKAQAWSACVTELSDNGSSFDLAISRPIPVRPAVGDRLQLEVACDKTYARCKSQFSNGLNFRGIPTLPGDDVAFSGPGATGNTGGKR